MNTISAFTKPWANESIEEIASILSSSGLDGVELCVREGYQIYSDNLSASLAKARKAMNEHGIILTGASGPLTENFIAACGDNGIPMIRILLPFSDRRNMDESIKNAKRVVSDILPIAEKYNVIIGIQEHVDNVVFNTELLYLFIKYFDSSYVRAIWDSAQSMMAGEDPSFGLGFILPYCCSVNLKNLIFTNPGVSFVSGSEGILDWRNILETLHSAGYSGNITLTHEYTDQFNVVNNLKKDCKLCREIMEDCR